MVSMGYEMLMGVTRMELASCAGEGVAAGSQVNLGAQLLSLLRRFGKDFNYTKQAVSLREVIPARQAYPRSHSQGVSIRICTSTAGRARWALRADYRQQHRS
jgi:hypothetical protein